MADSYRRHTAVKLPIQAILSLPYLKDEEDSNPNYLLLDTVKIFRINVMGVVVSASERSFDLDDGTGKLSLRSFDEPSWTVSVGDPCVVIGKLREFGDERYLVPEIVKKMTPEWLKVRKKELESVIIPQQTEETEEKKEGALESVIDYLRKEDKGHGVEVEEIIKHFTDGEKRIETMLKEGEIFENMPGRIKLLE